MTRDTPFLPAASKAEAVARLYALAGAHPEPLGPGSTERKSVLVAVANSLDLDVRLDATKPALAGQIATALGAEWTIGDWSTGSTITLRGLNVLLGAATEAFQRRHAQTELEAQLAQRIGIAGFHPARTKLEAVNRLSALTGSGPQALGPGSKERKSVLSDLAVGLGLDVDLRLPKPELGAAIAGRLGEMWRPQHWSSGQTITLDGLNLLLLGAERRLGTLGLGVAETFSGPRAEAEALLAVLADALVPAWDARTCIEEMHAAEFAHWRQTEWFGWYFEYLGIPALVNAFGGGPRDVLRTRFDYSFRSTWDLKAHSEHAADEAILNDIDAVESLLTAGDGLGFIVLSGTPDFSDPSFDAWHREMRGAPPAHEGSRLLKSGFTPTRLDAYHLPDQDALLEARARGEITVMAQGRQQNGAARKPKLKLHFARARRRDGIHIASVPLHDRDA